MDVNPDAFNYVSEDGKFKLEISSDGSVGLTMGVDKQSDRWKFTYFPHAKLRVLLPFTASYGAVDPGDQNDYSGVTECPLTEVVGYAETKAPEPTPLEQLHAHAEALERVNAAIDRHLDLRSQALGMAALGL